MYKLSQSVINECHGTIDDNSNIDKSDNELTLYCCVWHLVMNWLFSLYSNAMLWSDTLFWMANVTKNLNYEWKERICGLCCMKNYDSELLWHRKNSND